MRLIAIENNTTTDKAVVNTDHICSIYLDAGDVIITTADGRALRTKFTDVDHAVDYVQRAASVSFTGRT